MDIFVDLDGTLTIEKDGFGEDVYSKRTPRTKVIQKINDLYLANNNITIWTARYEEDREVTEKWLEKHEVMYHELILGKPKFHLYICDRVMNVEAL